MSGPQFAVATLGRDRVEQPEGVMLRHRLVVLPAANEDDARQRAEAQFLEVNPKARVVSSLVERVQL